MAPPQGLVVSPFRDDHVSMRGGIAMATIYIHIFNKQCPHYHTALRVCVEIRLFGHSKGLGENES